MRVGNTTHTQVTHRFLLDLVTMSTEEEITQQIATLGNAIKDAKAAKKPKEEWDPLLQEMLALKVRKIIHAARPYVHGQESGTVMGIFDAQHFMIHNYLCVFESFSYSIILSNRQAKVMFPFLSSHCCISLFDLW